MASPGELVEEAARALGLPVATLTVHDRNLVIAGARSKGGRGPSAAKVTARDAAHLLVAVLASAQVKESVHSLTRYRKTRALQAASSDALYDGLGVPELTALPASHSFVDAIEALIASSAQGSLAKLMQLDKPRRKDRAEALTPRMEIAALTPGTIGDVRISGTGKNVSRSVRYALPGPLNSKSAARPSPDDWDAWETMIRANRKDGDFVQYRRISEHTIIAIARLLAEKRED